jgi:hypothetical protein
MDASSGEKEEKRNSRRRISQVSLDSGLERDSHSYGDIYGEQESPGLLFMNRVSQRKRRNSEEDHDTPTVFRKAVPLFSAADMTQASDPFMLLRHIASLTSVAAAAAAAVEASRSRDEEDDSMHDKHISNGGIRRKSKATALLFDPLDYLDNSAMRLYFDTDSESRADVSLRDNDNIINTESTLAIESIEDNGVLTSPVYTISGSAVSSVAEPAEINQFSSTSTFIHVRHDIGQHRRSTRGIS